MCLEPVSSESNTTTPKSTSTVAPALPRTASVDLKLEHESVRARQVSMSPDEVAEFVRKDTDALWIQYSELEFMEKIGEGQTALYVVCLNRF